MTPVACPACEMTTFLQPLPARPGSYRPLDADGGKHATVCPSMHHRFVGYETCKDRLQTRSVACRKEVAA
jgi:hypothetical protein